MKRVLEASVYIFCCFLLLIVTGIIYLAVGVFPPKGRW